MSEPNVNRLSVRIFADCADIKILQGLAANPLIKGLPQIRA